MALRATVYKADLHIADNDRNYYATHSVTLARHPSETDERMMVRLLSFALFADAEETLSFTRGLSEADEPDLWRKDLTGTIELWVETGLPDDRRILKACGRSEHVVVMAYGRNAALWWQGVADRVARASNLSVYTLDIEGSAALADIAERKMSLNVNVDDATAWVSSDSGEAAVHVQRLR